MATKLPHKKALFMAKRNLMKVIGDKLIGPWVEVEEAVKDAAKDTKMSPYYFLEFIKDELDVDNLYDDDGVLIEQGTAIDDDEDEEEGETE